MTIQELKEKKRRLEEEIAEKIHRFEEDTGLQISSIDYNVRELVFDGSAFPVREKFYEVKIEAKL